MGKHYQANQERISKLSEREWKIALKKCEDHLKWKLKQKTLYGAHTADNLGEDPIDYYLAVGYEKILSGEWEWKPQYELADQMIRIIDSTINTEVEKVKTPKAASFDIQYVDPEDDFYNRLNPLVYDEEDKVLYEKRIVIIEAAIKGDTDLEYMWEAVKEGKKRKEIAELFEIEPKQLSKLRERFIEKVQKFNQKA
ncbi:hypothetical protein [Mucilaginibacter sp. 10B2]|uniref:hypothetical protein n=1 Tax=Mucilaginibacter sp. 10B2 TaxID=3048574 RepID=UPI002B2225C5|nr:hypothetical protein [Mucilaginibacter sp. 10B2]MEB0277203.1 hypothetical protein [Mucilaginibacter sp. 10B2]